ncbi:MAG TPA: SulP family inorganic anion transporter [Candidatus Limnocylindria bacterium]|nr:SulP family inorganic anion transporter [Candidatus Limnocylindria bacterium]
MRVVQNFFPDLVGYSKPKLIKDLSAGLTVGIVALPLSLALAIAAGVEPVIGLYTAGIAGLLAGLFAGSAYSVSGPAAAMVPVLVATVNQFGAKNLPMITMLAGLFLILFGLIGVGKLIVRIPESVVLGFTAGVAIVIFFGQLNAFFGLSGLEAHTHFHEKTLETLKHVGVLHLPTLVLGVLSVGIIVSANKLKPIAKIPSTLLAVAVATLLCKFVPYFQPVKTLSNAYGPIAEGLPRLVSNLPTFEGAFIVPALKIAFLIAIESLLCALVADRITKTKHRPGQELTAQGIANIGSFLFGGIPATAVIARTGTAIKSHAVSRVTTIIHALTVLVFLALLAPVANTIPLTALSAVLLVTAIRISEYKEVSRAIKSHAADFDITLLVTLVLTVITDLTIGVSVGVAAYVLRRVVFHRLAESRRALVSDFADDQEDLVEPARIGTKSKALAKKFFGSFL